MDTVLIIGKKAAGDSELRSFLEREGYEVLTAAGRADGLGLVQDREAALVIVDHDLGEDDGLEVLKEVREASPSSEVVLVTAAGRMETAIEVLRAGALDYLRRPLDMEQLRIALGRARERKPQRRFGESPRILVLEDHEPTRRRLVRILEKEGYRADGAEDGREGMRLYGERRFDLILADVRMPNMDGLAVLRETKGVGADVEVIVVTGYGDEEMVVQALREGAINFLRKPIDIEQMLLAVQKALEHQTLRRSLAHRNRDVELMQELVVRLTKEFELVVETPGRLSEAATDFLRRLVDAMPLGIVVVGNDRNVLFANRHVVEKVGELPAQLSTGWLSSMGVTRISEEDLEEVFSRVIQSKPGSVETMVVSRWSFLVMTPVRIVRPDGTERFVAIAIRGERRPPDDGARKEP